MKEKPSEWVSISDLMAGVMAVVMLLLVVSVLQQVYAQIKHKQELMSGENHQKQVVKDMLKEIQKQFESVGATNIAEFDIEGRRMILRDNVFDRGSACITPNANQALSMISPSILMYLNKVKNGQIIIEGHTDNIPVTKPVVDIQRFCTVYDDNITLSSARAREARKSLLQSQMTESQARRIIVAGYGESQPVPNLNPADPKNRRVEVRFNLISTTK